MEKYLNTISHVPCGSALNVFVNFCRDVIYGYTNVEVEDSKLWNVLVEVVLEQMANNYYIVTEQLISDTSKINKVIFSGGVASNNPLLREKIMDRFMDCDVSVASNETFYGLWKYVNGVNDGSLQ